MLELQYLSSQVVGRSWCCRPGTWRVSDGGHSQEKASLGSDTGLSWPALHLHMSLCTVKYMNKNDYRLIMTMNVMNHIITHLIPLLSQSTSADELTR